MSSTKKKFLWWKLIRERCLHGKTTTTAGLLFFGVDYSIIVSSQDETVKEILLFLNNRYNFIIEELDNFNLFVNPSSIDVVMAECYKLLDANTFIRDDEDTAGWMRSDPWTIALNRSSVDINLLYIPLSTWDI